MDPFGGDSEMRSNWRSWASILVPDYSLEKLTPTHRIVLLIVTLFLLVIALIGNLATIVFNVRRQIRPLFKSCLISLAISDIITGLFAAVTYFSQFIEERTVLWILGEMLCRWIPFLTTMAILVNSITLVCIALDRYMAVVKVVLRSSWEPKLIYCLVGTLCIWLCGAGIASPMLSAYFIVDITVAETDPNNRTVGIRKYPAQICISDKTENAPYYAIVFSCLFLPMFIAFLWLNATIAIEIWNRRNPLDHKMNGSEGSSSGGSSSNSANQKQTEGSTSTGTKTTSNISSSSIKRQITDKPLVPANALKVSQPPNPKADDNNNQLAAAPTAADQEQGISKSKSKPCQSSNNCRKTRQLRMFKVIIVIMMTFFVCRLPTWIFLLIKLNKDLTDSSSWVVHFGFGMLSLANCAINPFLYTFLTETIRFGSGVKERLRILCCCGILCAPRSADSTPSIPVEEKCAPKTAILHKPSMWRSCCWWDPCGKEELPDDKNLIDHSECKGKHFRRKSYTLNGKEQLSCISSNVNPPFGQYSNVYLGSNPLPIIPHADPNYFVDVDLANKK